jgi:hypothetical protein
MALWFALTSCLPLAELGDVLAVVQQRFARQQSSQHLLVLKQRVFTDVLTAREQRVKNNIATRCGALLLREANTRVAKVQGGA